MPALLGMSARAGLREVAQTNRSRELRSRYGPETAEGRGTYSLGSLARSAAGLIVLVAINFSAARQVGAVRTGQQSLSAKRQSNFGTLT